METIEEFLWRIRFEPKPIARNESYDQKEELAKERYYERKHNNKNNKTKDYE